MNSLSHEDVQKTLLKIAHDGVEYKGKYFFNFEANTSETDSISEYLLDATQIGRSIPSSFSKLVTGQFMKKVHQAIPNIYNCYPNFTLECIIEHVPLEDKIPPKFEIEYQVLYNLNALTKITSFYGDNELNKTDNSDEHHVNLDNFIGKGFTRLSEYTLAFMNKNKSYSFKFEQTGYLNNIQNRLDFLSNLYNRDTLPVILYPEQDFNALNMFGIFKIKFNELPSKNVLSSENSDFIKSKIVNALYMIMLKQDNIFDKVNLHSLGVINGLELKVDILDYLNTEEIRGDPI